MVPISYANGRVTVAMSDPFNMDALNSIAFLLGCPIDAAIATRADVDRAVHGLYDPQGAGRVASFARESGSESASDDDVRRLEDLASDAPVIKLVNELIARAVETRASDIHIEPCEDCVSIRLRIDGVLQTFDRLPKSAHAAVSSRIKIMSQLDIAERRLPQDGRISSTVGGRSIDLRVATIPTIWGENVVLRILNRSSVALDFSALGFGERDLVALKRMLKEPNGMLLVTGPTGSGKTTTLYTALDRLNDTERKLFSVEDPVEYYLAGVNQVQVNSRIGLTFSGALRSILRQDPDVIMIGEIRDLETAEIAVRASLTGHLVLSTLHTNSAAASITRLLDMGVEDYLLGSTLVGVLAQRLVRRLCPSCRVPHCPGSGYVDRLVRLAEPALSPGEQMVPQLFKAVGCAKCRGTGFSGRTAVYELLSVTDAVRDAISARKSERRVEDAAVSSGMISMLANGLAKALSGETTVDEILRVTKAEDATV
jgi:general secretion pathway protein E